MKKISDFATLFILVSGIFGCGAITSQVETRPVPEIPVAAEAAQEIDPWEIEIQKVAAECGNDCRSNMPYNSSEEKQVACRDQCMRQTEAMRQYQSPREICAAIEAGQRIGTIKELYGCKRRKNIDKMLRDRGYPPL